MFDWLIIYLDEMQELLAIWRIRREDAGKPPVGLAAAISALRQGTMDWDLKEIEKAVTEMKDLLMPMSHRYYVKMTDLLLAYGEKFDEIRRELYSFEEPPAEEEPSNDFTARRDPEEVDLIKIARLLKKRGRVK